MSPQFSTATTSTVSTALLILRVGAGVIITAHGFQKLFQIGTGALAEMWVGIVPFPQIAAPLISVLEFAGGIALILGLLTRIVAFLLACDMLGAIFLVHLPNGLFLPNGYEFVMLLLTAFATLALTGAGAYSVDEAISSRRAIA